MGGLWNKTVALLNRDIRSLLSSGEEKKGQQVEENSASLTQSPIESLVDPAKLEYLAFRRQVLDWRDGFHTQVTITLLNLRSQFATHIDEELDKVSIFRQLFAKPANEVLHDAFIRSLWVPFYSWIKAEESQLGSQAEKWGAGDQRNLAFTIELSDAEKYSLGDTRFKPKNRDQIIGDLETLLLGKEGLAEIYCAQATHLARQLTEEMSLC